jgi:protein TonB
LDFVLDTLNRYVQGGPGSSSSGLQDWRPGAGLDSRWPAVLTLSVLGHILFYVSIVALDWWVYNVIHVRRAVEKEQAVTVTMLAPRSNGDGSGLRAAPERLDAIDLRHMKFEAGPDDTRLLPRSPDPGTSAAPSLHSAGNGSGSGSSGNSGSSRGSEGSGDSGRDTRTAEQRAAPAAASDRPKPQLPASRSIQAPEVASVERTTPATLPATPANQPPDRPGATEKPRVGHEGGESGDNSAKSSRIGLNAAQSRYVGYVRGQIYRVNQRIMPHDYVETTLSGEVVAEFSLVVERSGRVRSVRLVRSCGYETLDRKAREAISLASPFEGFPPELGDTFEMTVDVHYTPFH